VGLAGRSEGAGYTFFRFAVAGGRPFTVTVCGSAGDFEAYVGGRGCSRPTRAHHLFSCTDGENVARAVVVVDAQSAAAAWASRGGGVFFVGVAAYGCASADYSVAVIVDDPEPTATLLPTARTTTAPEASGSGDASRLASGGGGGGCGGTEGSATANPATSEKKAAHAAISEAEAAGDVCTNCGATVPAGRMVMHVAFCSRHNTKCLVCDAVVSREGR
jgi:hypothetical protein